MGSKGNCWEWTGLERSNGYGVFETKGKLYSAHRFAFYSVFGPIPKDLYVCHKCDNRKCVRPSHLFLGTAKDNYMDMLSKGRRKISGEACLFSHYFNEMRIELKRMRNEGKTISYTQKVFNISSETVYSILKGKYLQKIECASNR